MLPLSAVLILLPPGRGTPGIFPLWQTSGRASPSAPCSRCSDGAGAKAIPDARRADGAPQQARTSPGPRGREGSRRCPARHAAGGVQPDSRDKFRVTGKRGVRGCRGCRGAAAPLTPCPTPGRRPAAHAGQQPRCKEEEKRQRKPPFPPLTPCLAPGRRPAARAGQQPQDKRENSAFPCSWALPTEAPHVRGKACVTLLHTARRRPARSRATREKYSSAACKEDYCTFCIFCMP